MSILTLVCMFLLGVITGILGILLWYKQTKSKSKKMINGYFKFNRLYKNRLKKDVVIDYLSNNTFIIYPKDNERIGK